MFRSAKTDGFRVIYCHDSWDRGGIGGEATVDRGIGGAPSPPILHPGEISYLRRTVCAEERAAYTYLHPPRRGPDTTL